jgi:ATP-binding cassette, subfamily A (ABC1), member 3
VSTGQIDYTTLGECERLGEGYGYVVQYNHTGLHNAPLFQTLADQALMRRALNNSDVTITTTIAPLPITPLEAGIGDGDDTTVTWVLIMISFPFISGACAAFVVAERESKAKHLQTVSGVQPAAYWMSTLLWDTLNYQIPLWSVVALMFIFDADVLTTTDRNVLSGVLAVLFLYGPAAAGWAYCWSFAFSSPSLCFIFLVVCGFLVGFAGPLTVLILIVLGTERDNPKENLTSIAHIITWCLRFSPPFCLGNALYSMLYIDFYGLIEGDLTLSAWSEPLLLYDAVCLAIQCIVYPCLAILLDVLSSHPQTMGFVNKILCECCGGHRPVVDMSTEFSEDDDVIAEQNRVGLDNDGNDVIILRNLTKTFRNGKTAVNNVSLGIPPGECFGLLGINGRPLHVVFIPSLFHLLNCRLCL